MAVSMQLPNTDIEDAVIAQEILIQKNPQFFEKIVEKYSTPLFNYIYRLLNNYEWACDVLQEVFIRCYQMLPSLHSDKPFKSWLFQVAHNYCIDEIRKKRNDAFLFSQLTAHQENDDDHWLYNIADPQSSVESIHAHHTLQRCLHDAIASLPLKQRSIVVLRYTSNLRFGEIAQILDMPEPTVKMYFYRAKLRLRKYLIEHEVTSSSL